MLGEGSFQGMLEQGFAFMTHTRSDKDILVLPLWSGTEQPDLRTTQFQEPLNQLLFYTPQGVLLKSLRFQQPCLQLFRDVKYSDYLVAMINKSNQDKSPGRHNLIINTETGEIVADVICDNFDLLQTDSGLLVLAGAGKYAGLMNVLTGELIQDFSVQEKNTHGKQLHVSNLLISKDGKELSFWAGAQYAGDYESEIEKRFVLQK
jgi:hypothetical protein